MSDQIDLNEQETATEEAEETSAPQPQGNVADAAEPQEESISLPGAMDQAKSHWGKFKDSVTSRTKKVQGQSATDTGRKAAQKAERVASEISGFTRSLFTNTLSALGAGAMGAVKGTGIGMSAKRTLAGRIEEMTAEHFVGSWANCRKHEDTGELIVDLHSDAEELDGSYGLGQSINHDITFPDGETGAAILVPFEEDGNLIAFLILDNREDRQANDAYFWYDG